MRKALGIAAIALLLGFAVRWLAVPGERQADAASGAGAPDAATAPAVAGDGPALVSGAAGEAADAGTAPLLHPEMEAEAPEPRAGPPQPLLQRLVAAGMSDARAAAIVARESRLRLDAAQTEYQQTGTIRAFHGTGTRAVTDALRSELAEGEYETYLKATGQPTRVLIEQVDPGSTASLAGLVPGDQIQSWRGQRVFNARELDAMLLDAGAGDAGAAIVVRDGQQLQVYLKGGPLGATSRSGR